MYYYTQLPTDPLPEEYKSYILQVNAVNDDPNKRDQIHSNFHLAGFEKKRSGSSEFKIIIEEYPFTKKRTKNQHVKTEKKDGVEKKTTYYYYSYEVYYKLVARILDINGEELYSTTANMGSRHRTTDFTSSKPALERANKEISGIRAKVTEGGAKKLTNMVSDKFGYPKKHKTLKGYRIKAKKHNYDDFDNAFDIAIEATGIVIENENNTEQCLKAYKPALDIWEDAILESDTENKKARINKNVTCASYYNIGVAYILCKDFDKALENFENIIEIDKKFSNTDVLIKYSKNRKLRKEANK